VSFTERVKVYIDVHSDAAGKGLKDLSRDVREADGFMGKLKTGASGLGGVLQSLGPGAVAGAAAAGVGAVGAAAYAAVDKFADLGIEVGKFAEATGMSAEESSRWVEVAGDIGIEAGTLEGALGKLNKAIDPEKFAQLGIEIVKTKDGATDVSATFLNVIDHLNGISDPAEKARVATQLLGRGWQDMAELIGKGSTDLKRSLGEVSEAKVFDDAKVEKAREMRAMMDELGDAAEDLVLQLGEALLPALVEIGGAAADMAEGLAPAIEGLAKIIELADKVKLFDLSLAFPSGQFAEDKVKIDDLSESLKAGEISLKEYRKAAEEAGTPDLYRDVVDLSAGLDLASLSWREGADAAEEYVVPATAAAEVAYEMAMSARDEATAIGVATSARQVATEHAEEHAKAMETAKEAAEAEASALRDSAAALLEQADAYRSSADAGFALRDAQRDYNETLAELPAKLAEAGEGTDDYAAALDEAALSAGALADSAVRVAEESAAAQGSTLSASDAISTWNGSMLNAASTAEGPLRDSILSYIASVNGIPPEKLTDIIALLDEGKIDEANAALNDTSAARTAAITAQAQTAAAEAAIDYAARPRTATITGTFRNGVGTFAQGGRPPVGEVSLVGERGPELFIPDGPGQIIPAGRTASMLAGAGSGSGLGGVGGPTVIVNQTINVLQPPTSRQIAEYVAQAERDGFVRGRR
jgi:hypothetical protein